MYASYFSQRFQQIGHCVMEHPNSVQGYPVQPIFHNFSNRSVQVLWNTLFLKAQVFIYTITITLITNMAIAAIYKKI